MKGKLRWIGIAAIEYVSDEGKVVLFDPWTKTDGNKNCDLETSEFKKVDLVLLSHDHFDHVSSAVSICKQTGAILGGPDETVHRLMEEEGMPRDQVINDGNGYIVGGGAILPWIKIVTVPANHTSRTSVPIGTIIRFNDGTSLYHTGDTGLTAEMEIFGRLYGADVMMFPIMPRCNMDVIQAAEAVRMVKPKVAIPVHYDVEGDVNAIIGEFSALCKEKNPEVDILITEKYKFYSLENLSEE